MSLNTLTYAWILLSLMVRDLIFIGMTQDTMLRTSYLQAVVKPSS